MSEPYRGAQSVSPLKNIKSNEKYVGFSKEHIFII